MFCTKRYLLLTGSSVLVTVLKVSFNWMVHSKDSFRRGKDKFFLGLENGCCRTWLRLTDSPNCETETAKRTLQAGSLTVPADGYTIIFQKAVIVM